MLENKSQFRRRLLKWYDAHRRDLPWRLPLGAPRESRIDPYFVLVSELMLQQTQVSTVVPYFNRFTQRFPTIESLAAADEQDILRLWQGLGYYSRARNLHRSAKVICEKYQRNFPTSAQELRDLPGIGRYTAGALASIAFDEPAPIVDGNVARVLARLDRIEQDLNEPATKNHLWSRAEHLVQGQRPGDFNSAMMELGATICTPRAPKCLLCPVAKHCLALAAGLQEIIPSPKKRKPNPLLKRDVLCLRHQNKYLIEQRPPKGRWASMWQFITIERNGSRPNVKSATGCAASAPQKIGTVTHGLTHRHYHFDVYLCHVRRTPKTEAPNRLWVQLHDLDKFPLPRPHLKIREMLTR